MRRGNCCMAGCNICSKAVFVKKTFYFEERIYSCCAYRRKHKEISAEDCLAFDCINSGKLGNVCKNCTNCK